MPTTTFVAYEYTNTRGVSNLHRNIIFRADVPERPITYFEASTPQALWAALDTECIQSDNQCDVMSLPHNSNLSNGQLFYPRYPEAESVQQREQAALRNRFEPRLKCSNTRATARRNGFENQEDDPFAFREATALRRWHCPLMSPAGVGCAYGLRNRWTSCVGFSCRVTRSGPIRVNPYDWVIGSTDTHNGTPGHVPSDDFPGHIGIVDDTPVERLGEGNLTHDGVVNNPGGLAGVWARE